MWTAQGEALFDAAVNFAFPYLATSIGAFWRQGPVFISDEHESGNTGTRPLEWIAITFKSDSVVTSEPPVQIDTN